MDYSDSQKNTTVTVQDIFNQNMKAEKARKAADKAIIKSKTEATNLRIMQIEYEEAKLPTNIIHEQDGKKYFFDGYSFTEING